MNTHHFAREAWRTEFAARYLWRALRVPCRKHLSRRCRNCILPESYGELGSDGICGECREYFTRPRNSGKVPDARASGEVDQLFRDCEGQGPGDYDAIVLFSGGKDSAYLLHRLTCDYPRLRLLAVLVDNGFMSPFALQNAARALARLDVDSMTVKPKTSFSRRVFRYALTHLERQEGYSIVDLMDGYITFDTARNLAARLEIPLIICGLSKVQAENVFGLTHYEFPRQKELAPPKEHAGIRLDEVFPEEEMKYWWDGSKWPAHRVPRFILPLVAWNPDERFILDEVNRLGLIDKRTSSPLLTNNALIPVIAIAEVARFGYTCFEVEFAKMIREGKSDRAYWLNLFEMVEYSAKTGRFLNKSTVQTLAALGLTKQDIGIQS